MSKFNRALWNELNALSAQERDLIKRFETDPTGPAFVAVSEILRKRGYIDESIVILEEGLKKFPQYHSARASLAKDYFSRGLMREAQAEITTVIARSPDNLMAQRLRLRLALVFDERSEALERLSMLRQLSPDDEFTRMVRDRLAADNWPGARSALFAELERQGVRGFWNTAHGTPTQSGFSDPATTTQLVLNDSPGNTPESAVVSWQIPDPTRSLASAPHPDAEILRVERSLPFAGLDERTLPAALSSGQTLASVRGDADRYTALRGFKMVQAGSASEGSEGGAVPISLESTTLAEIYESQGLHVKALEIYEKMLLEKPDNASLRVKSEAARERARAQLAGRVGASRLAATAPNREAKIRVLEKLLSRLDSIA